MNLQEYCKANAEEILAEIEKFMNNDEEAKTVHRPEAEEMFDRWFENFALSQPSEYFLDHPTNDSGLQSSILSVQEFMLTTLEIFGLPKGYVAGKGHFPDFGK